MEEDRSWMYNRILNGSFNRQFVDGVTNFLKHAFNTPQACSVRNGKMCTSCPCRRCDNTAHLEHEEVSIHLLTTGFCPGYEKWFMHGEPRPGQSETTRAHVEGIAEMVTDAAGPKFDWDARDDAEQPPNPQARKFFDMLDASQKPLWEIEFEREQSKTCEKHNVLSAITECLALKAENHMSEMCFNGMLSIMKAMLPPNNGLPENFYQAKRLVQPLGLGYQKIDVCPNNCMLYYKDRDRLKDKCDTCGEPRYGPRSQIGGRVPQKILRYLPITPRLQRMYMTRATAEHMRWHKEGFREKPGVMVHPADGQAWKIFDAAYPDFANEVRNVRLGLSTDGFAPYNSTAAPYTCWPVFVFPYNLTPDLIMREQNMFLALLIPGPKHPGRDIDVFLQPLIDELNELWRNGKETYDITRKQNFTMKAALMYTINDFPAYELLSGWGTKGRLACPYCMGETKAFRLKHGGKPCWFDCHRTFLPENHQFRRQPNLFKRNTRQLDPPPRILSGAEIGSIVNALPPIKWGKRAPIKQITGYGDSHHWQKKSVFWDLPYWSSNEIRHNLDMMHIEKNFGDNIINTILDFTGKTKDNIKSRLDLAEVCNRPNLNLTGDGKKPRASYALNLQDKRHVLRWLKEDIRFPDGYAANWSRCVNLQNCTITGLKSHDVHVFLERLMPVAFRDFLPHAVWEALNEVSIFFRELCAKVLDPVHIDKLEKDIIVTLCKLEKIFPPSFFDSMEHLVVHLAHEARMGGPVQFRWMYSSERCNKNARRTVTNKARVEGSIVEAYIIKEISNYCTHYFQDDIIKGREHNARHDDGPDTTIDGKPSIFNYPGRPLGKGVRRSLADNEYAAANLYVLYNCPEIEAFIEEFDRYIRSTRTNITESSLKRTRDKEFPGWVRKKVLLNTTDCDQHIKSICRGPEKQVICYGAYDINGFRFHTKKHGDNKKTDNSGVCIQGEACDYYGILEDVVELEYSGYNNKVVLLKCIWFDVVNGVKVDEVHGIVEIRHKSRLRGYEPFGLAYQAIQVYYLPYASQKRQEWWVAMKTKRKPFWGSQISETNNSDIFQEESPGCPYMVSAGENLDVPDILIQQGILDNVDPTELAATANYDSGDDSEHEQQSDNENIGEQQEPEGDDYNDW